MCFLLSMELREKWQRTSNAWLLCPWSHKQFWNGGKIAGGPFLRASLSCLFAWQVWTLGCFSYLIMNTAVGFGHRPEVAQWRRELVSLTRVNSQISALWRTVTWYRPSFTSRQCRIDPNSVEMSCCQSRWTLAPADYHLFSTLLLALKSYSESNTA